MNESKKRQLEDEAMSRLIQFGVSNIDRLNTLTLETPDLKAMKDEELAVSIICYGAALAKLTNLNIAALLQITTGAYMAIDVERTQPQPSAVTDTEKES